MKTSKRMTVAFFVCAMVSPLHAADVVWKNAFTFYGDNTEFFEPFRTGETILGQQGKSFFEAAVSPSGTLRAGLFGDFRSITNPQVTVWPLLAFEFRKGGARFVIGSLERAGRHGFLEPLSVTTMEFNRPVEYGFQWLQEEENFKAEVFLDWHELNTPVRPETLDYGFILKRALDSRFWPEIQLHGYHEGGQLYSVAFRNNWSAALGFKWKAPAGDLGDFRLSAFGVISGDLDTFNLDQIRYGGGGYLRLGVQPHGLPELFVIGWRGRDYFFQEGDHNYSSFNANKTFYRADRDYIEVGLTGTLPLGGDVFFNNELRIHWIDEFFAVSNRLAIYAPFELRLLSDPKEDKEKKPKSENRKP